MYDAISIGTTTAVLKDQAFVKQHHWTDLGQGDACGTVRAGGAAERWAGMAAPMAARA